MKNFLKNNDIIVNIQNMPKNILAIYVEILDKPCIVINDILHSDMYEFMCYSCLYFKDKTVGKITVSDLENKDFEPFEYARKEMKKNCIATNIV